MNKLMLGGAAVAFACLCIVLGIALAANTSVNLSVSVVPALPGGGGSTISCDIGPPYTGQIPAGAQRAGYTHCAVNMDFTQFTSANQIIECMGASSPLLYCDTTDPQQVPFDSAHYAIASDGGSNSIKFTYSASDFNSGKIHDQLWSFHKPGSSLNSPYTGWTMPEGFYIEQTWRQASNFTSSAPKEVGIYAPFFYSPLCCGTSWFENDPDEAFSNGNFNSNGPYGNSGGTQYPSPACCAVPSPLPDFSQYITVGLRLTSDGVSNTSTCFYLDRGIVNGSQSPAAQFGCNTLANAEDPTIWVSRASWYFPAINFGNDVTGITGTDIIYTKRVTIWSCSGWRDNNQNLNRSSAQCYPGMLTGTP